MKSTKNKLLSSIATLCVCFAMLIGSTYAWFTDFTSTGVNKIQAGNLDVKLLMYDGTTYVDISNDTTPIFGSDTSTIAGPNNSDTLWEPGKTQVAYLAIENAGNLDLKYKVALSVENVSNNLYEVMEYAITPDATNSVPVTSWTSGNSVAVGEQVVANDVSLPNGNTHYFALSVHMKEDAGNTYKNGQVNFDLTVYAAQLTSESDSFNNQYDKDALYDDQLFMTSFSSKADEIKFCADCYNTPGSDHSTHAEYLSIDETTGVAEVKQTGAWLSFSDIDWSTDYVLNYDVDLTDLADGSFIAFDSGETTSWQDLQVGFKKESGTVIVYNTLFANSINDSTRLGTLNGSKAHLVYKYEMIDNGEVASTRYVINMTVAISDGTNTYNVGKSTTATNIDTSTKLCWDVYTVDGVSAIYATLDNFLFEKIN